MSWNRGGGRGAVQAVPMQIVPECAGRALLLLKIEDGAVDVFDEMGNACGVLDAGTSLLLDIKQGCEAPWVLARRDAAVPANFFWTEIFDTQCKPTGPGTRRDVRIPSQVPPATVTPDQTTGVVGGIFKRLFA